MSAEKKRNYGKSILILVVISSLSKVFGFLRDIILTNMYGASITADAYLVTLSVPDLLLELVTHTITIGFVPLAVAHLAQGTRKLNEFTSATTKILLLAALVFTAVLAIFAKPIVAVLAPGFDTAGQELATIFLRIVSVTIVFKTVTSILQAYLNTTKYFTPAAFIGIILDVCVITAIVVSKKLEIVYLLPLGAVVSSILQAVYLFPFARKKGYRTLLRSKIDWKEIKNLLVMSIPALLAVGLTQISGLFNKTLASMMAEGSVTLFTNSTRISFFAESIIVSSIATVLYPLLSEYHLAGDTERIKGALSNAVDKTLTFLLPATVGLALLAHPVIDILYGHGEMTAENVTTMSTLMSINVIGIIGLAVQTLFTRALFSMKKVKASIVMSVCLLVVYLGSSWLFSHLFDLTGLAIATTVSYAVGGIAYYLVLNKICGGIRAKSTLIVLLKAVAACVVMGAGVWAFDRYVPIHPVVNLVLSIVLGVLVYAVMAKILKLKHFNLSTLLRRRSKPATVPQTQEGNATPTQEGNATPVTADEPKPTEELDATSQAVDESANEAEVGPKD